MATDRTSADPGAWTFDAVYQTHSAYVSRSARRLGVTESVLEDVVQDVFLVVHRRLAEFDGEAVRAWLFSILTRVARDKRRTLRRKPANLGSPARVVEDLDGVPDRDPYGPHESAVKAEAVGALRSILEAMPRARIVRSSSWPSSSR